MRGTTSLVSDRRRTVCRAACVALALAVASCGSGGGKDRGFQLPPGTEFDTIRSGNVVVAVETHNDCTIEAECAAPTSGPCELGAGNVRGLAIYRLGTTGLFFQDPADPRPAAAPEALIGTSDEPRRVIAHPSDPTLLYVATLRRIQVFRLASAGGTRCIAQSAAEDEIVPDENDDLDPIDLAIDPTIGAKGVLYVASSGANRLDAYSIGADGSIPNVPTSCAVGPNESEYATVSLVGSRFIVAAGQSRVDVYDRDANGQFAPRVVNDVPDATCINARSVSTPKSSIGAALVTDSFFIPTPATPLGNLFISEEVSRRLFTFPIDAEGQIAEDDTSNTNRAGVPQNLLLTQRGGTSILYASVFDQGRVDVFQLENGILPGGSFSRTAEDPDTLPVGLAVETTLNPSTLYVAEGGVGRVDGFRINADGSLPEVPVTSTGPMLGPTGKTIDSFPNDLAIVPLP